MTPVASFAQYSEYPYTYEILCHYDEETEEWSEAVKIISCSFNGDLTIPSKINDMEVAEIGPSAFRYNWYLQSVTIPASVTNIGDMAFSYCPSLRGVRFMGNAPGAGADLFADCRRLTVYYSPGASGWEGGLFAGRPAWLLPFTYTIDSETATITGYTGTNRVAVIYGTIMGRPVTHIQDNAFANCTNLANVTIPASVSSLGNSVFSGCTGLNGAYFLGKAPREVGADVFGGATHSTVYYQRRKAGWNSTFADRPTSLLPFTYTMNGVEATFSGFNSVCSGEVSVMGEIGGCPVTRIGCQAFLGCSGLTRVFIPASVTGIGEGAFSGCGGLSSVTLPASVTSVGSYAFLDCFGLTRVTLGNGVVHIGAGAFSGCTGLADITLPARVARVKDQTFDACAGLAHVTLPAGVGSIGSGAFSGCSGLADITLPVSVTNIGWWAFSDCAGLASVTLPAGVAELGMYAFSSCASLTNIMVEAGNANYSALDGILFDNDKTTLIRYPGGKTGSFTVPAGVTAIESEAVSGCVWLTDLILPASVTFIGEYALEDCTHLTNITVEAANASYRSQEGVLFDKLLTTLIQYPPGKALGSYTIPPGVARIEGSAFRGCTRLASIAIPAGVYTIGSEAFEDCAGLKELNVDPANSSYYSVEGVLFCRGFWQGPTLLKCPGGKTGSYTIPDDVSEVADLAFFNCVGLKGVTLPANIGTIGDFAFFNCRGLTHIAIPPSLSRIGDSAFLNCTGLTEIDVAPDNQYFSSLDGVLFDKSQSLLIQCPGGKLGRCAVPSGVCRIMEQAFFNCAGVTAVDVDADNAVYSSDDGVLLDASHSALLQCPASKTDSYAVPPGVLTVRSAAFFNCAGLSSVTLPTSVVSVGRCAFSGCAGLTGAYFKGDVPSGGPNVFYGSDGVTAYYVPGTAGWSATWGGCPTATWFGLPNQPPRVVRRSPEANQVSVNEGAPVAFSVTVSDGAAPDTAQRGMSNVTWYVEGVPQLVTKAGAPDAITSAFGLKTNTSTVQGAEYKDVQVRAVALDSQGGVTTVMWDVRVKNMPVTAQAVTFKALPLKVLGDSDFAPGATASSGLPVLYTSSDGSVAQFVGGLIHIVGAGTAVITASQAGDTDFKAAAPVKRSLTVRARLSTEVSGGAGTVSGAGLYERGVAISLTARPAARHTFLRWEDGSQSAARIFIMPNANVTVSACFGLTTNVPPPMIADPDPQSAMVGVPFTLPLNIQSDSLPTVTVTGLPAGLRYIAATRAITGVPLSATANKAVTVTARNVSGISYKRIVVVTVDPLPAWAQGNFTGWCNGLPRAGPVSMDVTAQGKVTGKFSSAGTNYAFRAASYARREGEGPFWISADAKAGTTVLPLTIAVRHPADAVPITLSVADGWLARTAEGAPSAKLCRTVWKEPGMAAVASNYCGYYTSTLPGGTAYGSGFLAFTVDPAGAVRTVGKLADGAAVTLSGTLVLDEAGRVFTVLYMAPAAYKGGSLFGLTEFYKASENKRMSVRPLDGLPLIWANDGPQATERFGSGFIRELGQTGGWYDTVGNVYEYYRYAGLAVGTDAGALTPHLTAGTNRVASACWDPDGLTLTVGTNSLGVMTGIWAPKPGVPTNVDDVYDYDAPNAVELSIVWTRATGLFKGSFKAWFDRDATHTWAPISFEGVLTPERETSDDGVAGRGFFLWADKSYYTRPGGTRVRYGFNRSYDLRLDLITPADMALIPAGSFQMGDGLYDGLENERPVHTVYVSTVYMDKHEVTWAKWRETRDWSEANGYAYENPGEGKGDSYPVHNVSWYDAVKWCNARSQKEGRTPCYYTDESLSTVYKSGLATPYVDWSAEGYRLPTEAEWERAARGGISGQRFPWGSTITHSWANYWSYSTMGDPLYPYDLNPTRGHHPSYATTSVPFTSPVGSFSANGYGLYDMSGNVFELCWDWFSKTYYSETPIADPRGPSSGGQRVARGGSWDSYSFGCRVSVRAVSDPDDIGLRTGFRTVLPQQR